MNNLLKQADRRRAQQQYEQRLAKRKQQYETGQRSWTLLYDRRSHLARRYNITEEFYQQLLIQQGGVCAICHDVDADGKRLCVDHNHDTGEVRGLLCSNCNKAIGLLQDAFELCHAAGDYLKQFV